MFDRIITVDWSANSTPKTGKDSIWIADLEVKSSAIRSRNISTRTSAVDLLADVSSGSGRVLVGVDFSLGYPEGTAQALQLTGVPWAAMWELLSASIDDDDRNANNRFEVASSLNERMSPGPGPFWGCHPSRATDFLTTTKVPSEPLGEWRTIEAQLRRQGRRPFSSWQLLGAGAVGSQSLLGIAALSRLAERLRRGGRSVDVWPFTSGLDVPSADVVVVEIWPTLIGLDEVPSGQPERRVRDERQVVAAVRHLAAIDQGAAFTPDVPGAARSAVIAEEGWLFGA